MTRLAVALLCLALLAAPLAAGAQRSGQVARMGYIGNGNPTPPAGPQLEAFRRCHG